MADILLAFCLPEMLRVFFGMPTHVLDVTERWWPQNLIALRLWARPMVRVNVGIVPRCRAARSPCTEVLARGTLRM